MSMNFGYLETLSFSFCWSDTKVSNSDTNNIDYSIFITDFLEKVIVFDIFLVSNLSYIINDIPVGFLKRKSYH